MRTQKTHSKVFFGGVPVGPEVNRLIDQFGVPSEGQTITHAEIEQTTGAAYRSCRFRTIVAHWRKRLFKEHNLDSVAEIGVGIRFLNPVERVTVCATQLIRTSRAVRRGFVRTSTIPADRLDSVSRAKYDHTIRIGRVMFDAATANAKALTYELRAATVNPRPHEPRRRGPDGQ